MTVDGQIVVPALALRTPDGTNLNPDATARYAQRAARTWADAFILSGSTTRGDQLTVDERTELLDLWTRAVPAARLVACCWCDDDVTEATRRAITPMVVMHSPRDHEQALALLACLPPGAYVYSHPKYDSTLLDASLTAAARQHGILPAGAKLSKVTADDITTIRRAAGPRWTLWDASARHINASLAAGASGVVATALSHLPVPFPDRSLSALQPAIDALQQQLDRPSIARRARPAATQARKAEQRIAPVRQTKPVRSYRRDLTSGLLHRRSQRHGVASQSPRRVRVRVQDKEDEPRCSTSPQNVWDAPTGLSASLRPRRCYTQSKRTPTRHAMTLNQSSTSHQIRETCRS